jgi:ketosteroid isomerase-like protein
MKSLFFIFFLLIVTINVSAQTASLKADETAIRQVLETESRAAKDSDYNTWIKCFAQSPDIVFGFHTALPTYMVRGYDELAAFGKKFFPESPKPTKATFVFDDFHVRINGNTAYATCLQITTGEDGKKSKAYKGDYLEKINGEWKMVGHLFGNVPEQAAEAKK